MLIRGFARNSARFVAGFIAMTGVDELMVATAVYDHAARLKSYELLAGV